MIKNVIMTPQIIERVRRAASDLGKFHFLYLMRQKRSTRGLPIIDKTPDIRIYDTMFLKYHTQAKNKITPEIIKMFLIEVFMYVVSYTNLIHFFGIWKHLFIQLNPEAWHL